ncbi:MAG: homoserine kinase [Deltaproteobacteria bacterium]|nr:homoserine kinase [Candidatus Anaeroferrophillacea bacterium]
MLSFCLRVPASTSNLGPGFDCFGLALPCYMRVRVESDAGGPTFRFAGEGFDSAWSVAADNLFSTTLARGIEAFAGAGTMPPASFTIDNEIPLARGLGSSGACVIAALVSAALIADRAVSPAEILALAGGIEGHGDNAAPALMGGFVIDLPDNPAACWSWPVSEAWRAVVIVPNAELATMKSRAVLPDSVSLAAASRNIARAALLTAGLLREELSVFPEAVRDWLHQPWRRQLLPWLDRIIEVSYRHGACATFLSGSGAAVVSLVREGGEDLGRRLTAVLADEFGQPARFMVLPPDNRGTIIETADIAAAGGMAWKNSRFAAMPTAGLSG